MSENVTHQSQSVLVQLDVIEEGEADMKATIEFLENHPFFTDLAAKNNEAKAKVRNAITELLKNTDVMGRKDVLKNDIDDRLEALLEKMKEKESKKVKIILVPTYVEFFRDLIEKSDGKKKEFYQALDKYTQDKPEERELLVKTVKFLAAEDNGLENVMKLQKQIEKFINNILNSLIEGQEIPQILLTSYINRLKKQQKEIDEGLFETKFSTPGKKEKKKVEGPTITTEKYLDLLMPFIYPATDLIKRIQAIKNINLASDDPVKRKYLEDTMEGIYSKVAQILSKHPLEELESMDIEEERPAAVEQIKEELNNIILLIKEKILPHLSEDEQGQYYEDLGITEDEFKAEITPPEIDEDEKDDQDDPNPKFNLEKMLEENRQREKEKEEERIRGEEKKAQEAKKEREDVERKKEEERVRKEEEKNFQSEIDNLFKTHLEKATWTKIRHFIVCGEMVDFMKQNNVNVKELNNALKNTKNFMGTEKQLESARKLRGLNSNEKLLQVLKNELKTIEADIANLLNAAGGKIEPGTNKEYDRKLKTRRKLVKLIDLAKVTEVVKNKNEPRNLLLLAYYYTQKSQQKELTLEEAEKNIEEILKGKKWEIAKKPLKGAKAGAVKTGQITKTGITEVATAIRHPVKTYRRTADWITEPKKD